MEYFECSLGAVGELCGPVAAVDLVLGKSVEYLFQVIGRNNPGYFDGFHVLLVIVVVRIYIKNGIFAVMICFFCFFYRLL